MNRLDSRDPLARTLSRALHLDAERAPQLPVEWIAPTTSSIGDDRIEVSHVLLEFDDDETVGLRYRLLWAVAAAAVAAIAAALALAAGDDDPAGEVPSDQITSVATAGRVGFVGLPPVGASPSLPKRGAAVLEIESCQIERANRTSVWTGHLTLFADGRLIWMQHADLPQGASPEYTGFLEQRLSPEGVELMRSELLDSGLLRTDAQDCAAGEYAGTYFGAGQEPSNWLSFRTPPNELVARLTDPASWLPASAWKDREIRAYVPSQYSVSLSASGDSVNALDPTVEDIAAQLPAAAAELLLSKNWPHRQGFGTSQGFGSGQVTNTDFTTAETRALATALDDAGLQRDPTANTTHLEYNFTYADKEVHIDIAPRLPNVLNGQLAVWTPPAQHSSSVAAETSTQHS